MVPKCILAALLALSPGMVAPAFAALEDSEQIARVAMSTASLWMVEHHEHAIVMGIRDGNLKHALHEAEELIPWMKGTAWAPELKQHAADAVTAVEAVIANLRSDNASGAASAAKAMQQKFRHLHHELMEIVAGNHGSESGHGGHANKHKKH